MLEQLLEERQRVKDIRDSAQSDFKDKHDAVKARMGALKLDRKDKVLRVGRFQISVAERKGREVSFETKPGKVIRIKPLLIE